MIKSYLNFIKGFGSFIFEMYYRQDVNTTCNEKNLRDLHKLFLCVINLYGVFAVDSSVCDSSDLQNYLNEMQKMSLVPEV